MSASRRRCIFVPLASLATLLAMLPFSTLEAQVGIIPHAEVAGSAGMQAATPTHEKIVGVTAHRRFLVVYRNSIPGDAETRITQAGAHLLKRHERFGVAIVEAGSATLASLLKDPEVEFATPDQLISAHVLMIRRGTPEHPVAHINLGTLSTRLPRPLPSAPKAVTYSSADYYYRDTPQGWAIKAVGGYGAGLAAGPVTGPWALSTGRGVRIAILDSGVDANHPDLKPNLALNLSEVDSKALPSPCDDGSPQDQEGHGSWAASLAAGAAGAGTGEVIGVAPSAVLLNIKVLQRMPGAGATLREQCANGQASGMISWVLQGIDDAVAQHADVISLSLGSITDLYSGDGAGLKASFDRATHAAAVAGVVIVASLGNEGFSFTDPRYVELPAQARDVLAVVASTNPACAEDLTPGAACHAGPVSLPYYSNQGTGLTAVAAPGGSYPVGADDALSGWVRGACSTGLWSTVDGPPTDANHSLGCFNLGHQQYVQAMGTSASAPLVAGVAALVRSAHPDWSAATVVKALRASAIPSPNLPYGQVNAAAALAYVP